MRRLVRMPGLCYYRDVKSERTAVAELLDRHGLRATRARCLILDRLLSRHDHMSAEEIRVALGRRGVELSVATLYQNLNRLVRAGLIDRFAGTDGVTRYDADMQPHAHLVCRHCGRIADISTDKPPFAGLRVTVPESARHYCDWSVADARLELRGSCPRCRRRS